MGWKDWFDLKRHKQANMVGMSIRSLTETEKLGAQSMRIERFESRADSLSPEDRVMLGMQQPLPLNNFSKGRYSLGSNLLSMWTQTVQNRRAYEQIIKELEEYYIAETILETMAEDALNPNERGEIMEFVSEDENLKEELDALKKTFDFDNLLVEVCEDMIRYGEYTLRLEIDPDGEAGVTAICDDLNQVGVLAMYERGVPSNFLVYMNSDYYVMPANQYAHFCLGGKKMRVRLDDAIDPDYQIDMAKIDPELAKRLPDYVRIAKPTFYKVIGKLRELQILEQLLVALKLNQITQSKFIGIGMPSSTPPKRVAELLEELEDILNSQTGVDLSTGQVTIADIMTAAGRFRAIPNFADEKGSLNPLNIREDATVDDLLKTIDNMRQIILSSIGIPYSLIYGMENQGGVKENSRANELRRYGRYARKLSKIQQALAKGLKQIAVTHLRCKGIEVTYEEFDVEFKHTMVDFSELERMEVDDAKQQFITGKLDLVKKMMEIEPMAQELDWGNVFEWLEECLNDLTGGIPLLKQYEDEEDEEEHDEMRREFVAIVLDNFVTRRQEKGYDIDNPLDGTDDQVISATQERVNKIMSKVSANFANRRRAKQKQSAEKHPQHKSILDMTVANFQKNLKKRRAVNGSD